MTYEVRKTAFLLVFLDVFVIIECVYTLVNESIRGKIYYNFKAKIPETKGEIYERTIKGVVNINYMNDQVCKPEK